MLFWQEGDAPGGGRVAGGARDADAQHGGDPGVAVAVPRRFRRHDAGAQDLGSRIRARRSPQANREHHRRDANLSLRRGRRGGAGSRPEALQARTQAPRREGAHLRAGNSSFSFDKSSPNPRLVSPRTRLFG